MANDIGKTDGIQHKVSTKKFDTVEEKMPRHSFDEGSKALGMHQKEKRAKPASGY